jgi:hypothetical protein
MSGAMVFSCAFVSAKLLTKKSHAIVRAHIYMSLRINAHMSAVCVHAHLYICTHADVLELERALPAAAAGARAAASGAGSAARARELDQIGGSAPASYKPP